MDAIKLSLSARRAWIEIPISLHKASYRMSLSARRAWIEMTFARSVRAAFGVALRKESVDRNLIKALWLMLTPVALRKESVDRNPCL